MPRKDAPQMFLDVARAQTGAALALAKARLLIAAFAPPCPSKGEVCESLGQLIEQLTPRGGQRPRLVFRLEPPTGAARPAHNRPNGA